MGFQERGGPKERAGDGREKEDEEERTGSCQFWTLRLLALTPRGQPASLLLDAAEDLHGGSLGRPHAY